MMGEKINNQSYQKNNQPTSNKSTSDHSYLLRQESITIEYLIHISQIGISKLLSDSRIKSICNKTNCQIELTTRILNKRINLYRWIKYVIIRFTASDVNSIKQCLKLLEKQFPIFLQRKEYTRKSNHKSDSESLTMSHDVAPTSLIPPIRSGPALPLLQGLRIKIPYRPTHKRSLTDKTWTMEPWEHVANCWKVVPSYCMEDHLLQSNKLKELHPDKWNRNESFEIIGSFSTNNFKDKIDCLLLDDISDDLNVQPLLPKVLTGQIKKDPTDLKIEYNSNRNIRQRNINNTSDISLNLADIQLLQSITLESYSDFFPEHYQLNKQKVNPSVHIKVLDCLDNRLLLLTNSSEHKIIQVLETSIDFISNFTYINCVPILEEDHSRSKFELIFPVSVSVNLASKNTKIEADETLDIIFNNIFVKPQVLEVNSSSDLINAINIKQECILKWEIGKFTLIGKVEDKFKFKTESISFEMHPDSVYEKSNCSTDEIKHFSKDKTSEDNKSSQQLTYISRLTNSNSPSIGLPYSVEESTDSAKKPIVSGELKDDQFMDINDEKEQSFTEDFQFSSGNYAESENFLNPTYSEMRYPNLEEYSRINYNKDHIQSETVQFSVENCTISSDIFRSDYSNDVSSIKSNSDSKENSLFKHQSDNRSAIRLNSQNRNHECDSLSSSIYLEALNKESMINSKCYKEKGSFPTKISQSSLKTKKSSKVSGAAANFSNIKTANFNSQNFENFNIINLQDVRNESKVNASNQHIKHIFEDPDILYYQFQVVNSHDLISQSKESDSISQKSLDLDRSDIQEVFISLDEPSMDNTNFDYCNMNMANNTPSTKTIDKTTDKSSVQQNLSNKGKNSLIDPKTNDSIMKISQNRTKSPENRGKIIETPLMEYKDQDCYYLSTHLSRENEAGEVSERMIVTNKITFLPEDVYANSFDDDNEDSNHGKEEHPSSVVLLETFVHNDKSIDVDTAKNLVLNEPNGVYIDGVNKLQNLAESYRFTQGPPPPTINILSEDGITDNSIDEESIRNIIMEKLKLLKGSGSLLLLFDGCDIYSTGTQSTLFRSNSDCCLNKLQEFKFESSKYNIIAKLKNKQIEPSNLKRD